MTELSITQAWSEAIEFLKREFGLVFLIAFLFICLPGAALSYVLPVAEAPAPVNLDAAVAEIRAFLGFMPVLVILAMIGTIAINYLAIVRGASVGEALGAGLRRFVILLLATILIGLVAVIAILPLLYFMVPELGGTPPSLAVIFLLFILYLAAVFYFSVKLLLITPVAAAERGGPIALMVRSWTLSQGYFWKLLGFQILFWLAASVLLMLGTVVIGLVLLMTLGVPTEPGTGAFFAMNLASAALQALVSCAYATTVARIYTQLTGAVDREIFA